MENRNKLGTTIALVFSIVAFILTLHDLFSSQSPIQHSSFAWFIGFFTLLTIIFSVSLYSAKTGTPLVINVLSCIVAGILTIIVGSYWILICVVIVLIGCIMDKAARTK